MDNLASRAECLATGGFIEDEMVYAVKIKNFVQRT